PRTPQPSPSTTNHHAEYYHTSESHMLNPQRTNVPIYKIIYNLGGKPPPPQDLSKLSSIELVKLQLDSNDWLVRHARRILQERGQDELVHAQLRQILNTNPDITRRLRALWSLHVTGGL